MEFRPKDAATVISGRCEDYKGNIECSENLRENITFISRKFQDMKEAYKAGTMTSEELNHYEKVFEQFINLDNMHLDMKALEKEIINIILMLK